MSVSRRVRSLGSVWEGILAHSDTYWRGKGGGVREWRVRGTGGGSFVNYSV